MALFAWIAIGLITGSILGLTGAGGAVIAIPLMIYYAHLSVIQASSVSLIVVGIGAALSWAQTKGTTRWRVIFPILFPAILSASFFGVLKSRVPTSIVEAALLLLIGYAVWATWAPIRFFKQKHRSFPPLIGLGIGVGGVTALTGLGGGLILNPIYKSILGMEENDATKSSLMSITITTTFAVLPQLRTVQNSGITVSQLAVMIIGLFTSVGLVRTLATRCSIPCHQLLNKIVFTIVLFIAFITLLLK